MSGLLEPRWPREAVGHTRASRGHASHTQATPNANMRPHRGTRTGHAGAPPDREQRVAPTCARDAPGGPRRLCTAPPRELHTVGHAGCVGAPRAPRRAALRHDEPGQAAPGKGTRGGRAPRAMAERRVAAPGTALREAPRPRQRSTREPRRAPGPGRARGEGRGRTEPGHHGRAGPGTPRPCRGGPRREPCWGAGWPRATTPASRAEPPCAGWPRRRTAGGAPPRQGAPHAMAGLGQHGRWSGRSSREGLAVWERRRGVGDRGHHARWRLGERLRV
jgi:hypothetical protein